MANLTNALQQLRTEQREAQLHVETLDQAISVIESLNGTGVSRKSTRPTRIVSAASRRKMAQAQRARWARARKESKPASGAARTTGSTHVKGTLSASARSRISLAQKKRWAKIRKGSKPAAAKTAAAPAKRTMSASARRKIAAAQRARWAKVKAQKKTA